MFRTSQTDLGITLVVRESAELRGGPGDFATTIGQFKTPMLRDLEDSAPYFRQWQQKFEVSRCGAILRADVGAGASGDAAQCSGGVSRYVAE